ncbi:MAG: DNA alkylation repair protein [Lachnospiraceae bacterium]|nr:DNA alkylation repair protein [Lachnospiraceae bacterium]
MTSKEIRKKLQAMQDLEYKAFHCKLMPGIEEDTVIGVRTPMLRNFAKEIYKSGEYEEFLNTLPHKYYDEMNLHGFIICEMKDYEKVIDRLEEFLPYVNNWATCDLLRPQKAFKNNLVKLEKKIKEWMASKETYIIRFGMEMLMTFYLDENFKEEYLEWVAGVKSEEYYVNMMRAWYFATALAKQYEKTLPILEKHILDDWTHKKSIQKARESYRITKQQKEYLQSLK